MTKTLRQSIKISITLTLFFVYAVSVANWALASDVIPAENDGVSLKQDQLIDGDYVRLSHVFNGVGAHGDHILAPAPAAGDALVLGLSDLNRINRAFDLNWQPTGSAKIAIRRDAQVVAAPMLKEALKTSELQEKIGTDFRLTLENPTQNFAIKGKEFVSLDVEDVFYDRVTEQFSANVVAKRDDVRVDSLHIRGKAAKVMQAPVLSHRVRHGEVIKESDLSFVEILNRDVTNNMIMDKEDVIGMTPRRTLGSDEIILTSELTAPLLVRRNEVINIELSNGAIKLSTKGKAMSAGAKGETIQIMNSSSKKIIEAVVTGPQQAVVIGS